MATDLAQQTYTYRQSYPNSCGAACLLCAAYELGIRDNGLTAGPIPDPDTQDIFMADVLKECEKQIYWYTSTNHANPNDPRTWGYNMPSNIVRTASRLGLRAWAVAYGTRTVKLLERIYPAELQTLNNMDALVRNEEHKSYLVPVGPQRELKILLGRDRGNFGALHYVMVRPNNTVWEPSKGQEYTHITQAKTNMLVPMHGTGLSVFITRR